MLQIRSPDLNSFGQSKRELITYAGGVALASRMSFDHRFIFKLSFLKTPPTKSNIFFPKFDNK